MFSNSIFDVGRSVFTASNDSYRGDHKNKKVAFASNFFNSMRHPPCSLPSLLRDPQHLLDGGYTIHYFLDTVLAQAHHFFPACFVFYLIGIIGFKNEAF
jgi:hypothetical protein